MFSDAKGDRAEERDGRGIPACFVGDEMFFGMGRSGQGQGQGQGEIAKAAAE